MSTTPEPTASPCIRNCCLNENNVCLGCGRTLDEIRDWSKLSDTEKRAVNELARARHQASEQRYLRSR
ncbi:MAG: DUF1289 domain-containing protein [Gammaproteobacteria bacterium]